MSWPSTPGPTNYQHPFPNYQLNDLHQAMDYNSAGEPIIRVGVYPGATDISTTDAFGRARSAQPFTLFDSAFIGADNGKFDTATTGGASTSFSSYASAFNMTVGTASGDQVVRQSYRVFPYQPGKALEIFNTFVMAAPQTNLRQRVGYFTAYNGIYLEQDGRVLEGIGFGLGDRRHKLLKKNMKIQIALRLPITVNCCVASLIALFLQKCSSKFLIVQHKQR